MTESPPFRKEMLNRLTIYSLCLLCICNFGRFPFWFRGQDFVSDCTSSWSLLSFYFTLRKIMRVTEQKLPPVFKNLQEKIVFCERLFNSPKTKRL